MNSFQESAESWNSLASLYEEKFMDLELYLESYDEFLRLLGNGVRVLDLACGPGNISKYLLSKRPELSILGTDLSPEMIRLARKNNPSAEFAVLDGRDIVQTKLKFDGIIAGFALPYFSKDEADELIKNCGEILQDGGVLYMSFVEGKTADSGWHTGSSGHRVWFHYHQKTWLTTVLLENQFHKIRWMYVEYEKADGSKELHTILTGLKRRI